MSRWGGLRVYWHYWLAFLAGNLLAGMQYGFYLLNFSLLKEGLPPYFEATMKLGDFKIASAVIGIWGCAMVYAVLAGGVCWAIVKGEKEVRGKRAFKAIPWDVNPLRPLNLFGGVHVVSFFFWGQAVFWSVATRFPPMSVNAGWKTTAALAGMFFAGMGVQIGSRLVTDRYFYEGKDAV